MVRKSTFSVSAFPKTHWRITLGSNVLEGEEMRTQVFSSAYIFMLQLSGSKSLWLWTQFEVIVPEKGDFLVMSNNQ